MAEQVLLACDKCGRYVPQVEHVVSYTLQRGGSPKRRADLCPDHEAPLDDLFPGVLEDPAGTPTPRSRGTSRAVIDPADIPVETPARRPRRGR